MSLTQKDLTQIKGIVHGEVNEAVDTLARIVNKGFERTASKDELKDLETKIGSLEAKVDQLQLRIAHLDARTAAIERDTAEIRKQIISHNTFDDIVGRVSYLERKLGIKSGK